MTRFHRFNLSSKKNARKNERNTRQALKKIEVEGMSGGNAVKLIMNGDGELKKISLNETLLKESKEIIEDLISCSS